MLKTSMYLLVFLISIFVVSIKIARYSQPKFDKTVSLPKPVGKFCVGITNTTISLKEGFFGQNQKALVFYPSQDHSETTPYMPGYLKNGVISTSKVQVTIPAKENGSPIADQKFPIIFFSPGAKTVIGKYSIMASNLASHGYLVVCLENPDSKMTLANIFYEVYMTIRFNIKPAFFTNAILKNIDTAEKDLSIIVEHINKLSFAKNWDKKNIILMGHSIGATISHRLGFKNNKISAIVDLDPSYVDLMSCLGHQAPFDRGKEIDFPENINEKPFLLIHGNSSYNRAKLDERLKNITNLTINSFDVDHGDFLDNPFLAKNIHLKEHHPTSLLVHLKNMSLAWLFQDASHQVLSLPSKTEAHWHDDLSNTIVDWLKENGIK